MSSLALTFDLLKIINGVGYEYRVTVGAVRAMPMSCGIPMAVG